MSDSYEPMEDVAFDTMFGQARVFETEDDEGCPVRILWLDGAFQSATYLDDRRNELVFEYYRAFDNMFEPALKIRSVLMIGGGGFAYPKHFLHEHPQASMDIVEIDPAIVEIAHEYFYLDELADDAACGKAGSFEIFTEDGKEFLEREDKLYDAIINDSFEGHIATESFEADRFLSLVKQHLTPSGIYLVNVVTMSSQGDYSNLFDLVHALERHFLHVSTIPCSDDDFAEEENYLVLATDLQHTFSKAIPY